MGESGGLDSILNREIAIIGGVVETVALAPRCDISIIDSRFYIYLHSQSPTPHRKSCLAYRAISVFQVNQYHYYRI